MSQTNAAEARELARLSTDCSFLLTHLIRQTDDKTDVDAKNILASILNLSKTEPTPLLKSSTVGWYGTATPDVFNPKTNALNGPINNKAVCFTESTLSGLKAHREMFNAKYGVAFDRDFLFEKGANPCLNIRESMLKKRCEFRGKPRHAYNFIPSELQPFVNVIHDEFDSTHEREWRIAQTLAFELTDVLFIFCPAADFKFFSQLQFEAQPVLFDLAWLDRV